MCGAQNWSYGQKSMRPRGNNILATYSVFPEYESMKCSRFLGWAADQELIASFLMIGFLMIMGVIVL
ncbi:MAG: hypothetical protein NPIRA06_22140 [Nitrospirales bacterium]|nr:MAG: hypothetical protein NPIRA06_22140 [Nitrospirales bacterium]